MIWRSPAISHESTATKNNLHGKLDLHKTTIVLLTTKDLSLVDGGARPETNRAKGCQL